MPNKKFKILIVDDTPENLEVTTSFLTIANYTVFQATGGIEAIQFLETKTVDLILMDVSMPNLNGFETSKRIKNNPRLENIPIIFLSAQSSPSDKVKGFDAGAADYISKPVNFQELLRRIKVQLEIKTQKAKMIKQYDELKAYNIKIRDLAQKFKLKNKDLISSINYAKFIQETVLPSEQVISQYLPQSFILFIPRDIVSGDFYWVRQVENQILIAVVDCTGHGVPGALLSMLGITFLNEIVSNYPKSTNILSDDVLNYLRERVKETMNQNIGGPKQLSHEGMDVTLCIIDVNTKEMQFSGANRPLYIVRNNQELNKNELITFKPDVMPIGKYFKERPFSAQTTTLLPNDQIFMFTDGYVDQFGGEEGNKFYVKNLQNLFLEISDLPLKEQKQVITEKFHNWKGNFAQTDDVLILSFKMSETYGDDIELF